MWFAVAIIGMIGIATGITLLPGGTSKPQPAASAPARRARASRGAGNRTSGAGPKSLEVRRHG